MYFPLPSTKPPLGLPPPPPLVSFPNSLTSAPGISWYKAIRSAFPRKGTPDSPHYLRLPHSTCSWQRLCLSPSKLFLFHPKLDEEEEGQ